MSNKKITNPDNPKFWIGDYWNAWQPQHFRVFFRDELPDNKLEPVRTFQKYVEDQGDNYGKRCDLAIIPKLFIHQNDRLVRIYNNLISQEEIDLGRVEKVIKLAQKVIQSDRYT